MSKNIIFLMNLWYKTISNHPIDDINNYIKRFPPCDSFPILNGNYKQLPYWTPAQLLLFHNIVKYKDTLYYLLEKGCDLNIISKKGVNFYQLFLILIYYNHEYQKKEIVELFIDFLKFGFSPNQFIIISPGKIFTILDCLIRLQRKDFIQKSFFSKQFIFKNPSHRPLNKYLYEYLYISLLCYRVQTISNNIKEPLNSIHIENMREYMKRYQIFNYYILVKFKLPLTISEDEVYKRIKFLFSHKNKIKYSQEDEPIQPHSNFEEIEKKKKEYCNPDFIENSELQYYEFFPEVNHKFNFHKSYFPLIYKTKINPYNRLPISDITLRKWKQELNYNFPIMTLGESLSIYPYIFSNIDFNKKEYNRNLFFILESYFNIFHPYHQISSIVHLKPFQIQYLCYVLSNETSFLNKFKYCIKKPTYFQLFKIMYSYCKSNMKNVNIIYFLMEEILQDIFCYEKLKECIDQLDDNSSLFYNEYYARFGTYNPQYMRKFIENLLQIHRYYNYSSSNFGAIKN